jgi:hypothetical protein
MKQLTTALGLLLVLGFTRKDFYPVTVCFQNRVGGRPLELSTVVYTNPFGEPFTIEQCKYYIGAIRVTDQQGNEEMLTPETRLIDQADTTTLTLRLSCSLVHLRAVRFTIGVDSAINTGAVMTGDLDPVHGMFWTWNSGFIYARLEGQSDSAKASAHRFTWDVGGYKANANAAREIVLAVPDGWGDDKPAGRVDDKPVGWRGDKALVIKADLLKWFDGRRPIRLSQSPTCHEPGALAMRLADNYATMFSIAP